MNYPEDELPQPAAPSRRWIWIAIAVVLVLISVGAYFVERWMTPMRDAEKMQALVKTMGARLAEADRESAARIEAHQRNSQLGKFGPDQAIVPAIRAAMRAWVAGGILIIDESLAKRAQIPNDTIAQIEASKANDAAKKAMVQGIRDAVAKQVPLSVKLMQAMRAYLAKIGEMVAFLDLNAQAIQVREGQLEFDEAAAGEEYNKFEHELVALERELESLIQQQRR